MFEVTITNEQKVLLTLNPQTEGGHPAPVDGVPVWTQVSGNSTVNPAADGMSAELVSEDNPGDSTFRVTADADLGSGIEEISGDITLHVVAAEASNVGLTAGQPTPK